MADIAQARTCPRDGTFTACAGAFSDEVLVGTCAVCKLAVTMPNPYFNPKAVKSEPQENVVDDAEFEAEAVDEEPPEDETTASGEQDEFTHV